MSATDTERAVIICAAINGSRRQKSDHRKLPMTPKEIAEDALGCMEAGATMLHFHVRDDAGNHSLDADKYKRSISAIRERVGDNLVLQITTESAGIFSSAQQISSVREVCPEAVSVCLSELLGDFQSPVTEEQKIKEKEVGEFLLWLKQQGIFTQYIIYSVEELLRFKHSIKSGLVPHAHPSVLFVLGKYISGNIAQPLELLPFLNALGDLPALWSVCAFGPNELGCLMSSSAFGGHTRVGFENNLLLHSGKPAKENAELVSQLSSTLPLLQKNAANPKETRQILSRTL